MLKIKHLSAETNSQPILNDINLEFKTGEIHAIMGPKNSGKSALVHAIAGHPGIQITDGSILWNRKKLQDLDATTRSNLGIGVTFQTPPEFEGISNFQLIRSIYKEHGSAVNEFDLNYQKFCALLDLGQDHGLYTSNVPNPTESRIKKNELLYILLKDSQVIILDELDNGLEEGDIILVASIIKGLLQKNKIIVVVTHNQLFLKLLKPTHVHIMVNGEIKMSDRTELYTRIIEDGYPEFS